MLYTNIKKYARQVPISIMELERRVGVARSSICKWDRNAPSIKTVAAVAKELGVTVDALLKEER